MWWREDAKYTSFTLETRERYAVVARVDHETGAVSSLAYPVEGWAIVDFHDSCDDDDEGRDSNIVAMIHESGDSGELHPADTQHLFLGLTAPNENYVASDWQELAERAVKHWHEQLAEAKKKEQAQPSA